MAKKTLDFSQVKDAGSFSPRHKPEGEYLGTITSFSDTKSKAGADMWVYGVTLKSDRRAVYPTYCLLGADQLWKLRNIMMAAGFKVPKKRITVDPERLVGKEIGVYLEDDEYEGKMKSVISSFFPADEYSGPDDSTDDSDEDPEEDEEYEDDEAPADDEEESEDEAPADEDDETEDDEDEEEEPPAKPARKAAPAKAAPARAKVRKPAPAEDDDEMDVEDL